MHLVVAPHLRVLGEEECAVGVRPGRRVVVRGGTFAEALGQQGLRPDKQVAVLRPTQLVQNGERVILDGYGPRPESAGALAVERHLHRRLRPRQQPHATAPERAGDPGGLVDLGPHPQIHLVLVSIQPIPQLVHIPGRHAFQLGLGQLVYGLDLGGKGHVADQAGDVLLHDADDGAFGKH